MNSAKISVKLPTNSHLQIGNGTTITIANSLVNVQSAIQNVTLSNGLLADSVEEKELEVIDEGPSKRQKISDD